ALAILAVERDVDPDLAQRWGDATEALCQRGRALRPALRLLLGFGRNSIESSQKIGGRACEPIRHHVHVGAQHSRNLVVFQHRLDCFFDVAGVGGHERALRPKRALTGRHPLGEVGHAGLAIELHVRQGLEPMGHCRQQRAQNAWTFLLELRPKLGLKLTLLFRDRRKGQSGRSDALSYARTWLLRAAIKTSCSLRGSARNGTLLGSTRARRKFARMLLALPCSPVSASTG